MRKPTEGNVTIVDSNTKPQLDLKIPPKSVDESKLFRRKSTTSSPILKRWGKASSVDTINTSNIYNSSLQSPRSHLLSSPRLQTLSGLLDNCSVTKIKKIGRGFGSGTTIWEVNVNISKRKSIDNMLLPNSENFEEWESKLSHCCMKELMLNTCVQYEIDAFIDEIDKLRRLPENHKNIMQFLGFQVTNESIRIFTKLYDGTLSDILRDRFEKLTVSHIVKFSLQIASALMVIHSRRMMHRDIKSANVFYSGNPMDLDNLVLILGDYGESKYIDAANRAKTCVGTDVWIAPEVLTSQSKNEYSFAADMYSFGMLMYELMALNMPYHNLKGFESVSKIISGEKPTLTTTEMFLYQSILDLWHSLIDTNVEKRPTSAKVFCLLTDFNDSLNDDWTNL